MPAWVFKLRAQENVCYLLKYSTKLPPPATFYLSTIKDVKLQTLYMHTSTILAMYLTVLFIQKRQSNGVPERTPG